MIYINTAMEINKEEWLNPIKGFADDSLFFPIDPHQSKEVNIYLRQAHLVMDNSWNSLRRTEINYH